MAESIAGTYGASLFEVACEKSLQREILDDLNGLTEVFAQNPDFYRLLCAPVFPAKERGSLLRSVLSGQVEAYTLNFLCLLIEKSRFGFFSQIVQEYKQLHNDYFGIQEITVRTALPIKEPLRKKLEKALGNLTKKTVLVNYVPDESLLAGIRIDADGAVLDGSVRERLDALGRRLTEAIL